MAVPKYCPHIFALVLDSVLRFVIARAGFRPKSIATCSHAFSRAWCRQFLALASDWFIGLSAFVVIDQNHWFGFKQFYNTQLKLALKTIWRNTLADLFVCFVKNCVSFLIKEIASDFNNMCLIFR